MLTCGKKANVTRVLQMLAFTESSNAYFAVIDSEIIMKKASSNQFDIIPTDAYGCSQLKFKIIYGEYG